MADDICRLRNEFHDAEEERSLVERVANSVPDAYRTISKVWEKAKEALQAALDKQRRTEETPWCEVDHDTADPSGGGDDGEDYDENSSPLPANAPATPAVPDSNDVSGHGGTVDVGGDQGNEEANDEEPNYGPDNPFRIDDLTRDAVPDWLDVTRGNYHRFKRRVYIQCVRNGSARRSFVMGVPPNQQGTVRGQTVHRDLVADAERLLTAAEAAIAAAKAAGVREARNTNDTVRLSSTYRDADHQFRLWNQRFNGTYVPRHRSRLEALTGDPLSNRWVRSLARRIGSATATPGYSLHQRGISLDFSPPEPGVSNVKLPAEMRIWRGTWFYLWLVDNASTHGFEPYDGEAWHWNYTALVPESP